VRIIASPQQTNWTQRLGLWGAAMGREMNQERVRQGLKKNNAHNPSPNAAAVGPKNT